MAPAEVVATRKLMGLSAREFAEALKVRMDTVYGWEVGKYAPGPGSVRPSQICSILTLVRCGV